METAVVECHVLHTRVMRLHIEMSATPADWSVPTGKQLLLTTTVRTRWPRGICTIHSSRSKPTLLELGR